MSQPTTKKAALVEFHAVIEGRKTGRIFHRWTYQRTRQAARVKFRRQFPAEYYSMTITPGQGGAAE